MKSKSRKFTKTVAGLALAASVAVPGGSFARAEELNTKSTINSSKEVCGTIESLEAGVLSKIDTKIAQVGEGKQSRSENIKKRHDERLQKITERRNEWDRQRMENIGKINLEAKTQAQIDAVKAYEATLKSATEEKRGKIDQAINQFKLDIESLRGTREKGLDTTLASFRADIVKAIAKAKADCASGVSVEEARKNLEDTIAAKREELKGKLEGFPKVKANVETYQTNRLNLVKKAEEEFKNVIEKAREVLKAAFK